MDIVFVIPSFYPATAYGGPVFASWYVAKALGARGHRVRVSTTNANLQACLPLKVNQESEVAENVFVTYYHDTVLNRLSLPQLGALLPDLDRADIVHVHSIFNALAPAAMATALAQRKPVILTPHGSLSPDALTRKKWNKQLWLHSLIRPLAKRVAWHATSPGEARDITSATEATNVSVIRHGLPNNIPPPRKLDRKTYFEKFAPGRRPGPSIVSMGRLEINKGFDILIDAFFRLRTRYADAVLLIAGPDQGERGNLEALTRKLGIEESVVFHDFLGEQDRSDFFAHADVFALASHHENFGMVYAEALALGTPIVATHNTPWQGVDEAGCGRWVACNAAAIADAMTRLLDGNRKTLRDASIAYARKFSIEDVAKQFEETYRRLRDEKQTG